MAAFEYTSEIVNANTGYFCKPEFLAEIDYPTDEEIFWEINNLGKIEKTQ